MADFQVRAVTKYVMGSPLKARRVVNTVRGMPALQALEVLGLMPQAAAEVVAKTIKSAVANADENFGLDANDLIVAEIMANEGPRLRRVRFGARGRVKPIRKRTCHITVVLEEQDEEEAYFGA
ncbi:MAG: 50S ribosomal protein L22 [Chloroflexota bacterium]